MRDAAIHDVLLYGLSRGFLEQLVARAGDDYLVRIADTPRLLETSLDHFNPDLLLYHATGDDDLTPVIDLASKRKLPPVILLTNPWIVQRAGMAARLIDLGLSNFIPLPTEPVEILARLENYFVRNPKPQESVLFKRLYRSGEPIFLENEVGHECYAIESGRVRICRVIDSRTLQEIAMLGPGEIFGEMALLRAARRSSTALAVDDVVVTVTTAETFNRVVETDPRFVMNLRRVMTERITVLEKTLGVEIPRAGPDGREASGEPIDQARRRFAEGTKLYEANHLARRCYLVETGRVRVTLPDGESHVYGPGSLLGDVSWHFGRAYGETAEATEETICVEIGAQTPEPGLAVFMSLHYKMARNLAARLQELLDRLSSAQMSEVF